MIFQIVGPYPNFPTELALPVENVFLVRVAIFIIGLLYFGYAALSFRHVLVLNNMVKAKGTRLVRILAGFNLLGAALVLLFSLISLALA